MSGEKSSRIIKSTSDLGFADIRRLYDGFDAPIAVLDCGKKCAPHNLSGKPFCCDICHAVPAAYKSEWKYLEQNTGLWHKWHGSEYGTDTSETPHLLAAETPKQMILLACLDHPSVSVNFAL